MNSDVGDNGGSTPVEPGAPETAEAGEAVESESNDLDTIKAKPAKRKKSAPIDRPYPRRTLEDALRVGVAIKDNNGGNPWSSDQIASALGVGAKTSGFYYLTSAARDFGITTSASSTASFTTIGITELGRRVLYPQSAEDEEAALLDAFFSVDVFKRVVDHFHGSQLPDKKFLANTLQETFGLDARIHDEFVDLFSKNCKFVGIGSEFDPATHRASGPRVGSGDSLTVSTAAPGSGSRRRCFVIMPFSEKTDAYAPGFFDEVYRSLLEPSITKEGFEVETANRQGSDIIHRTIVTKILAADLVVADLTEHNPNVLFELGLAIASEKPIALIRAKGTGKIFDVDNLLRVLDYNPNLWPSTVAGDLSTLGEHITAAWEARNTADSYMKVLTGA